VILVCGEENHAFGRLVGSGPFEFPPYCATNKEI